MGGQPAVSLTLARVQRPEFSGSCLGRVSWTVSCSHALDLSCRPRREALVFLGPRCSSIGRLGESSRGCGCHGQTQAAPLGWA